MLKDFSQVIREARSAKPLTISVAVAQDGEVLKGVKKAMARGLANAVLAGNRNLIRPLAEKLGLKDHYRIIHEPDDEKAALKAVELVRNKEAQILMKGLINSSNFLRAAPNPGKGLRSGRLLSHLTAFEIQGIRKLAFFIDGGINIAPSLAEKKEIPEGVKNKVI